MELTIKQLEDLIEGISENNKADSDAIENKHVLTGSKAIDALKEMSAK